MSDRFVIAWAISQRPMDEGDCWIMVRHKERGWELPGGAISDSETEDEAALRELYEETGVLGTAKAIEDELVSGGCVVLIEVDEEPTPISWKSEDPSIAEVGWCFQNPEENAWGIDEIERLRNHDWRTSRILGS